MSDAPHGIITATTLRLAVKAKISAGNISQRSVSLLIHDYSMQKPRGRRRSPVEDIPPGRREAFLGALDMLSSETTVRPLARRTSLVNHSHRNVASSHSG
jgi:hypothetical protein